MLDLVDEPLIDIVGCTDPRAAWERLGADLQAPPSTLLVVGLLPMMLIALSLGT